MLSQLNFAKGKKKNLEITSIESKSDYFGKNQDMDVQKSDQSHSSGNQSLDKYVKQKKQIKFKQIILVKIFLILLLKLVYRIGWTHCQQNRHMSVFWISLSQDHRIISMENRIEKKFLNTAHWRYSLCTRRSLGL